MIDSFMKIFGFYRAKEVEVECLECKDKFIIKTIHEDDVNEFELCPECNLKKLEEDV